MLSTLSLKTSVSPQCHKINREFTLFLKSIVADWLHSYPTNDHCYCFWWYLWLWYYVFNWIQMYQPFQIAVLFAIGDWHEIWEIAMKKFGDLLTCELYSGLVENGFSCYFVPLWVKWWWMSGISMCCSFNALQMFRVNFHNHPPTHTHTHTHRLCKATTGPNHILSNHHYSQLCGKEWWN